MATDTENVSRIRPHLKRKSFYGTVGWLVLGLLFVLFWWPLLLVIMEYWMDLLR